MIYMPSVLNTFDLRLQLAQGIYKAVILALQDFIAEDNKPWLYYAGAANGYMAAATGIPGAAATLYAIGNQVNLMINRSPDGGLAQIYVNGILAAQVDTWLDQVFGDWISFVLQIDPTVRSRIDIVNAINPNPLKTSPITWLALGPVTASPETFIELRNQAVNTLVFRIRDAEQNSPLASVPVYLPPALTLAQVETYAFAIAPQIDALTEGAIAELSVTFSIAVPGGVKSTPDPRSVNERGGLITFNTTGPRASSVRIPAISHDIMPGDSFSLTHAAVAALVTRLTTATTAENIRPLTEQGYQYVNARAGAKSFRRK